jgi:hypothetical protein
MDYLGDHRRFSGRLAHHLGELATARPPSRETPWFWTITARVPQGTDERGYAATREEAMAQFKARWMR